MRFADRIASRMSLPSTQDSGYPKTRAVIDDFAGTVSDPGAGGTVLVRGQYALRPVRNLSRQ